MLPKIVEPIKVSSLKQAQQLQPQLGYNGDFYVLNGDGTMSLIVVVRSVRAAKSVALR